MGNKVLIVDDQPGIRLLVNEIVTNEGHQATIAQTGKEATDLLQTYSFDMLIVDYKLPIMNGVEVIQQAEKYNIHIPVIMITGMEEAVLDEVAEKGLEVSVLSKPFNAEDLSVLIREMSVDGKTP